MVNLHREVAPQLEARHEARNAAWRGGRGDEEQFLLLLVEDQKEKNNAIFSHTRTLDFYKHTCRLTSARARPADEHVASQRATKRTAASAAEANTTADGPGRQANTSASNPSMQDARETNSAADGPGRQTAIESDFHERRER